MKVQLKSFSYTHIETNKKIRKCKKKSMELKINASLVDGFFLHRNIKRAK